MKRKRLPVFVGIASMIMALAMSLVGCDNNDDEPGEYLKYSWYIQPDTARGEDGNLYFHELWYDTNNGFIDSITGIRFKKADYPNWNYDGYVSRTYKSWSMRFDLVGTLIRPSHNYPLFREYCIKYGVRPLQRTPFDEEMQKVLPCVEWTTNGYDLCCQPISTIKVITHRDFDANHPAGSDIADIMRFGSLYLDDYVTYYKTNYTESPRVGAWYWLQDLPVPFETVLKASIPEYTKAPRSLLLNGNYTMDITCGVIPQLPGDYLFTVTVIFTNGKEISVDVLLKVT